MSRGTAAIALVSFLFKPLAVLGLCLNTAPISRPHRKKTGGLSLEIGAAEIISEIILLPEKLLISPKGLLHV
jgi:hypothetical protein